MNRIYEELFVLRPDVTEEEVDAIVEALRTVVTNTGGTLDKVEKWGVRKLAYRVEKRTEGFYILLLFTSADPNLPREIERRLRVNDAVMKFITVRIDVKMKKIEKRKKAREKRAARKPAPPVQAPGLAMPAAPAEPGVAHAMPGAPAPGAPAAAAPVVAAPVVDAPGAETPSEEQK
jgi:small subunit ribosomal protein S6